MHFKMIATKASLIFLALFAGIHLVVPRRVARSPDTMEVDVPNQAVDRESGEYQEGMNQEASYWQGQLQDKEQQGHNQLDEDREKNKEDYEHEKEHYHDQQHGYHSEMNDTYQEDRDKAEAHHHANQDHYDHHHDGHELQGANHTAPTLHSDAGDRYGDKGSQYLNEREDQLQNYDAQENAPTISYNRG